MLRAALGGPDDDLRESERRALATSSGGTGGFTVSAVTAAEMIDKLVNASRLFEAGAQRGILPGRGGEFSFPKHSSGPATQWVAENATLSDAEITFSAIKVVPRILACGPVKIPRKLLDQGEVNLERFVTAAMQREMAIEIDRAGLFGLGTAREPNGLTNQLTGTSVVTGTGVITNYDEIVDATKVLADNNAPDATAVLLAPREDNTIAKFKTGITSDNTPLMPPPKIANLPFLPTNQIPITEGAGSDESRMIVGHFPHMSVMFQGDVMILPLRERYAEKLQVGFIAYVYVDVAVAYPTSFVSIGGITLT